MDVQISNLETQSSSPLSRPSKLSSSRIVVTLSAMMALQMTSFVMIIPLFARRFNQLGAGVEALSISAMVYAVTSALAAPFWGALADRIGKKPLVLVSLVAHVAAYAGYLFAQSANDFIVLRGLAGAFTAGLAPAVIGLAADLAPQDCHARWISFIQGGASFGWIAGPISGGMIYDRWGYATALAVSIVMAVLTLLMALLAVPESRFTSKYSLASTEDGDTGVQRKNIKGYLLNLRSTLPNSLSIFIVLLLISFSVLFVETFVEPRAMFYAYNELGCSSSTIGLVMSMYGIAMMFGELAFGQLSDRLGRKPVIILGLVLFTARFMGMAFSRNYILVMVTFGISGLGNALFDPALSASFLDISPIEHRARVLGIKSMAGSIGNILGPALAALFNSSIDARSVFLISAGIVLLAALVFGRLYERTENILMLSRASPSSASKF